MAIHSAWCHLYQLHPHKQILLIVLLVSFLIEGIQYFAGLGSCELDDIISNSLGGWIGFCIEKMTSLFFQRIN